MSVFALTAGGVFLVCLGLRLFPGEKNRDAAAFAFAVVLLSLLAAPVAGLVRDLPDTVRAEISFVPGPEDTRAGEVAEDAFALGIRRALCEKFDLSPDDVTVRVRGYDMTSPKAETVSVYLTGHGVFSDARGVRRYLLDNGLCGECYVEIG